MELQPSAYTVLSSITCTADSQDLAHCLKPKHTAAYMLDPKYAGKSILSGAEITQPYGVLTTASRPRALEEGMVLGSLALSTSHQGLGDGNAIWHA